MCKLFVKKQNQRQELSIDHSGKKPSRLPRWWAEWGLYKLENLYTSVYGRPRTKAKVDDDVIGTGVTSVHVHHDVLGLFVYSDGCRHV